MTTIADRGFDKLAGEGAIELSAAVPAADLASLKSGAASVSAYVDKHLAHSDAKPIPAADLPKLSDVHDAIDTIGNVFRKYFNLLTGDSMVTLVPIIQSDWLAVFREPWIRQTKTD